MTDEILLESRRDLRERAFQALMALEYDGDIVEACRFAYLHDKDLAEDKEVDLPAFLMNLVTGVYQSKDQLDQQIGQHLKTGWTVERLTLVEKNILRLGIYEMTEFDTPQIVAVNEAVELAKAFSDEIPTVSTEGILLLDTFSRVETNGQEITGSCYFFSFDLLEQKIHHEDSNVFEGLLDGCQFRGIGLDELGSIITNHLQILRNLNI